MAQLPLGNTDTGILIRNREGVTALPLKTNDMELKRKGCRIYLNGFWYLVPNGNEEYDVYDDGEWEGKYCGCIETLEGMTQEEALEYVLGGL